MKPYSTLSDPELSALLRQGDHAAFEVIYRRYAKDLYRYARKNIAVAEDCEEIVQDIFTSLWTRHADLDIESPRHYLLTAVRFKIIRYFRHHAVKKKYASHYTWFTLAHETMEEESFDPEIIQERIMEHITELPERCQMVIRLRITENLSHTEIAERMNITRKTVEMHMLRAFDHLRNSYTRIYKTG